MSTIAVIAIGGALGALARYGLMTGVALMWQSSFPLGTMVVNVVGSLLMGVLVAKFSQMSNMSQDLKLLCTTGFLGAFTTFSTYSLDALLLWERGEMLLAACYVIGSVLFSLLAVVLGFWIIRGSIA